MWAVTVAAVSVVTVTRFPPSRTAVGPSATTLRIVAPGTVGTSGAKTGTVYSFGMPMWVGLTPVTLLSARAREVSPGLRQLDPLLGYSCDRYELPYGVVGEDPVRAGNHVLLRPLAGAKIDGAKRNGTCWYVLLRVRPDDSVRGRLTVTDGELRYKVGRSVRTVRWEFSDYLSVNGPGPDWRELPNAVGPEG